MTSISEEWVRVSEYLYKTPFIDELDIFLRKNKITSILECGCGGGHVLYGLAKKGYKCLGIDSSSSMISLAKKYSHNNLAIEKCNWLELAKINQKFGLVMCRGNSLGYVESWEKNELNPSKSKKLVKKSLDLMFEKVSEQGLLYVDTAKEEDVKKGKNQIIENSEHLGLKFKLFSHLSTRSFHVWKGGEYVGVAISYLITSEYLQDKISELNPVALFEPNFKTEKNYFVLCARK